MGSAGKQAHILYAEGHVAPTAVDHRVGVDRLAALQLLVGPEPDLLAGALDGVVLQPACKDASLLRDEGLTRHAGRHRSARSGAPRERRESWRDEEGYGLPQSRRACGGGSAAKNQRRRVRARAFAVATTDLTGVRDALGTLPKPLRRPHGTPPRRHHFATTSVNTDPPRDKADPDLYRT